MFFFFKLQNVDFMGCSLVYHISHYEIFATYLELSLEVSGERVLCLVAVSDFFSTIETIVLVSFVRQKLYSSYQVADMFPLINKSIHFVGHCR